MEEQLKKSFMSDTARAGLIMGVLIAGFELLTLLTGFENSMLKMLYYVLVIGGVTVYFGRKRAEKYGELGFSYGQGLGFCAMTAVFAGIIVGVVTFIMVRYVSPEYYKQVVVEALKNMQMPMSSEQREMAMSMSMKMLRNPLIHVIGGILNMLIYTMLVGLITSVFIKRPTNPFAEK